MKQTDSIKQPDTTEPNTAPVSDQNETKEGFWAREVRLFKAEMAGWGIGVKKTKAPKSNDKKAKKTPVKKVKEKNKSKSNPDKPKPKFGKIAIDVALVTLLFCAFCLITFASAVYAYQNQFKAKAFYGTKILGQDVGGMNLLEVRNLVAEKADSITLTFTVEGKPVVIKPMEAGIKFNPDGTSIQALRNGKNGNWMDNYYYAASSLLYKIAPQLAIKLDAENKKNLALSYAIDDSKMGEMTQNLSQSFNVQSQNAGLVMKGGDVQVIPAVYGKKILTDSVKAQLAEAVRTSDSVKIDIEVEKVNPAIVESDTQASIDAAKTILNLPVKFTYKGQTFVPDKATQGGWIVFETKKVNDKDQLVPRVDSKLVWPYVYSLASKINVAAVNKKVTVTNGGVQTVNQEGKDGLAVDANAASATTASALTAGKPVALELPTYAVKFKTNINNVLVADWAKYIEVNLSAQRMCAYLAGGDQQGCWSITSGATAKGYYTPTGTFLIQRKVYVTSMPNPPSPYPLKNIHYVSYFTPQGHAIHEAWWRTSFGGNPAYNGSHGCVNASYTVAQWIYNWAPIGTPVIIHY